MYKEVGLFGDLSEEIEVVAKASATPGCNNVTDNKTARQECIGFKMNEGILDANTSFLLDHGCLATAAAIPKHPVGGCPATAACNLPLPN
ncbi:hypothetical protein Tco_0278106 [Tanacetum coccineum]